MIKRLYSWLYRATAKKDEQGVPYGGIIQHIIRESVLGQCRGMHGKALEIGVGTGLFIAELALQNPGLKVWGIDTNDECLDLSAKNLAVKKIDNVRLLHQDAKTLSFDDDFFDLVICVNFFIDTDMESMTRVLSEMKRVCNPSGRIIFEFRNSRNALFRLKYALARHYDPTAPYPLYTYDPASVDRILGDLNLRIIDRKYIGLPIKYLAPIIMVEAGKK